MGGVLPETGLGAAGYSGRTPVAGGVIPVESGRMVAVPMETVKHAGLPLCPMKSFYITTAIDYVNGSPHIGHAYEKVLTDVIARFRRLMGDQVHFLTGTATPGGAGPGGGTPAWPGDGGGPGCGSTNPFS